MTHNQLVKWIESILANHAMIKTVKSQAPGEWINNGGVPLYPCTCFDSTTGTFATGRQRGTSFDFWFLDKVGDDKKFEQDVISDQLEIAEDIVQRLRLGSNKWSIDDPVTFRTVADGKFEDKLAGCEFTITFTTTREFDACDIPGY